jgi:hypothetical protein
MPSLGRQRMFAAAARVQKQRLDTWADTAERGVLQDPFDMHSSLRRKNLSQFEVLTIVVAEFNTPTYAGIRSAIFNHGQ